jgi:exosortase C (VPDSG-CTERM-specific)
MCIGLLALVFVFAFPILRMGQFVLTNDLYSYVLLVPLVSGYIFWSGGSRLGVGSAARCVRMAGLMGFGGALSLGFAFWVRAGGRAGETQDFFSVVILAFVFLAAAVVAGCSDAATLRRAAFPLGFLVFFAPFPTQVERVFEDFLQHGSAPPAAWLFSLAGTPYFKQEMVFQLPGITIQIAPECSGIRSTIVLFMTSLLAGYLFLRSPWKRGLLVAFVLPLALVRNGFRIFTIGELCVHIGPHMIDSDIHHKGGAIFFALSLLPFFLVLYFLARSDRLWTTPRHDAGKLT